MPRLILLLAFFALSAAAQSIETSVYVEQFSNLTASLERIYTEASNTPATAQTAQDLRERLFALKKPLIICRKAQRTQTWKLENKVVLMTEQVGVVCLLLGIGSEYRSIEQYFRQWTRASRPLFAGVAHSSS
jgi:hypothetical protein